MSKEDQNKLAISICTDGNPIFDGQLLTLRQQFDAEMKKVDVEMTKFCNNLITLYQLSSKDKDAHRNTWEELFASPLIDRSGSSRILSLKFDVSQFEPEEVSVKVHDQHLIVAARHECKTDDCVLLKEYQKKFFLPKGLNHDTIICKLSQDGVLLVEIPMPDNIDEKPKNTLQIMDSSSTLNDSIDISNIEAPRSPPNVLEKKQY